MTVQSAQSPRLEFVPSRHFTAWMHEQSVSLSFTTYQAGKLFFLGLQPDGQLSIFERTFNRSMGLWSNGQSMWMASLYQLWRFENALSNGDLYDGYDGLYVPQIGITTGDLDIHDVAAGPSGNVFFANTLFSCVAAPSGSHSFRPVWKPTFITQLAAEDRCHLNGLATSGDELKYVTAIARSDVADGWRDQRRNGGIVIDAQASAILTHGLSMPHSPRIHNDQLWLLDSGNGFFGAVDAASGRFERMIFCPGYLRGLAFHGRYAVVGVSRPRGNSTFQGLALDDELAARNATPQCGFFVIDTASNTIVHWLKIDGFIEELYDIVVLPGVRRPMALGFKTNEIERVVTIEA